MFGRLRRHVSLSAACLMAAVGIATVLPPGSASAQNLFEFLFGGIGRVLSDQPIDPDERRRISRPPLGVDAAEGLMPGGGPRMAYCVRLCDGRFFPIETYRNTSAAAQCNSFCPASATMIVSGRGIENAAAGDGRRYADLPNAFVHRQRIVPGCTCDAKTSTGVAHLPVANDPTLRPGDIVATNTGLTVYRGGGPKPLAAFTPVESAKISRSLRNRLADMKVTPRLPPVHAGRKTIPQDETAAMRGGRRGLSARKMVRPLPRATANVLVPAIQSRTD